MNILVVILMAIGMLGTLWGVVMLSIAWSFRQSDKVASKAAIGMGIAMFGMSMTPLLLSDILLNGISVGMHILGFLAAGAIIHIGIDWISSTKHDLQQIETE